MRPREAGVARADEREQVAAAASEPGEAQKRQECPAERRLRQAERPVQRVRDAERAERRLERRTHPVERGTDDEDLLGSRAGPDQAEHLVGDELEGRTRAGGLEEPDRAVDGRRGRNDVGEQRALEVRQRRMRVLGVARRQLLDAPGREPREIGGRALERGEGRPRRLVRERDSHVRPAGERLEQAPLRRGQVLEPVGVDRAAVPGLELAGDAVGRVPPAQVGVPEVEAVELGAVRAVELGEVAVEIVRVEQAGLQLGDRRPERVRKTREACGAVEISEPRRSDHTAEQQRPLRITGDRSCTAVTGGDPLEQVVERADRPAEQRTAAPEQVALDALDIRAVRHDQDGLAGDIREIPLEQQRDFAGVRRSGEQRQTHRSMVVPPRDDSAYVSAAEPRKVREKRARLRLLRLALRLAAAPRLLGSL